MTFYQVRDKTTGKFYKRHHGRGCEQWVAQDEASVWTTLAGARACFGAISQYNRRAPFSTVKTIREPEVVTILVNEPTSVTQRVTLVFGPDWEGLYLDGFLVEENHGLRVAEVLEHLGIVFDTKYADQEWIEERGRLPDTLGEVKEME